MSDDDKRLHLPVLLEEAITALAVSPEGVYVDATFGRGGHSAALLERLGDHGRLFALDQDAEAVDWASRRFGGDPRFTIRHGSFGALRAHTDAWGVTGSVNGILFDVGVSSPQLADPRRGFSFMREGPLDMRMDTSEGPTAAAWLQSADEAEIASVLKNLGEERYARRIARAIVGQRASSPIRTTSDLVRVVEKAVPRSGSRIHPATRTFQAIRIAVNRELEVLQVGLQSSIDVLAVGGRLVVISFHSLEDRIVKHFIREHSGAAENLPRRLPVPDPVADAGVLRGLGGLTRPGEAETARNARARSARMRVAERRA